MNNPALLKSEIKIDQKYLCIIFIAFLPLAIVWLIEFPIFSLVTIYFTADHKEKQVVFEARSLGETIFSWNEKLSEVNKSGGKTLTDSINSFINALRTKIRVIAQIIATVLFLLIIYYFKINLNNFLSTPEWSIRKSIIIFFTIFVFFEISIRIIHLFGYPISFMKNQYPSDTTLI